MKGRTPPASVQAGVHALLRPYYPALAADDVPRALSAYERENEGNHASRPDELLTIKRVSGETGLSVRTIWSRRAEGKLVFTRVSDRAWRIRRSELTRYLDSLNLPTEETAGDERAGATLPRPGER